MKKIAAILTSILFIFSNIGINVMAAENDISEYPIISITNGKEIDNNEAETLINNMITGVVNEYSKELQVNGVGYRVTKQGTGLNLSLGFSHPVIVEAPEGITFDVPNANTIIVKGIDKELVGQTAAEVRSKRPPEVYGGKGIKYADEVIRRKEGKTGK